MFDMPWLYSQIIITLGRMFTDSVCLYVCLYPHCTETNVPIQCSFVRAENSGMVFKDKNYRGFINLTY